MRTIGMMGILGVMLCGCGPDPKVAKLEKRIEELDRAQAELISITKGLSQAMVRGTTNVQSSAEGFGRLLLEVNNRETKNHLSELNSRIEILARLEALESLANKPPAAHAPVYVTAERLKELRTQKASVWGTVIQRLGNDLLVDAGTLHTRIANGGGTKAAFAPEIFDRATNIISGTILLTDYERAKSMADGDEFVVDAYPSGFYEYTAVSGAKKTVRRYSVLLMKAAAVQK